MTPTPTPAGTAALVAAFLMLVVAVSGCQAAARFEPIGPRLVFWRIAERAEIVGRALEFGFDPARVGALSRRRGPDGELCEIWTEAPRHARDHERWRQVFHELRHCEEGQWHG